MNDLLHKLLALPEPDFGNADAIDYTEIATEDSIGKLTEIIESGKFAEELDEDDADNAIIHAYRALGSRGEMRFFDFFVSMLRSAVLYDDDLYCEDFIELMTRIGNDTIPGLLAILHDQGELEEIRSSVIMALDEFAKDDAVRDTILGGYVQYLAAKHPTRDINALLTCALSDHGAVDHFPVVRELYEENVINVGITGDLEEAEVQFGLKNSRDSKAPNFHQLESARRFDARKEQLGPPPDTEDPLDIIAYFLDLYETRDGMISVSQLDGFLLACVASPQIILPSRYIPFIWDKDGDPDAGPIWESAAHAQLFTQSLMDLHNKAVHDLQDRAFSPIIMVDELDEERKGFDEWALGAVLGVTLWDNSAPLQALTRELVEVLLAIVSVESENEGPDDVGQPGATRAFELLLKAYEEHRQLPGSASPTRFYSDRHPYEREAPKVGRNDPCPCGSGKKYKKCCMN